MKIKEKKERKGKKRTRGEKCTVGEIVKNCSYVRIIF